jgi:hypothetical protein
MSKKNRKKLQSQLPDAEAADVENSQTLEEKNEKTVTLWKGRFTRAENFRKPFIDRNLRMYKLYRAYRNATNYAYETNIMPPTGFEIVETIKPRLASAEIKVNIYPTKKEDVGNDNIKQWDDLVEYDLQVMEFEDLKIQWINAMLIFGNGFAQLMWEGDENGDPLLEIVDNWLFYPDPQAMNRLKNSRWEEETKRGENKLYPLILDWKKDLEDESNSADDPRRERYEINTKKMGQINDGRRRGQGSDAGQDSSTPDKTDGEKLVEIWECWDHVEHKLVTIFNRKKVARDEENPYMKMRKGQVFIDLPDISLNWELYAMSHLEPVETTIYEIADSRNQAMDDIVFSLDPIKKVKKGAGYKTEDFKHEPGATWFLNKADDVVIERPPEVSQEWIAKDNILRREIETSLAMSEYVRGIPKGPSEPASKVELLLTQTNIRFSLLVRQMEISFTQLVNACIELNQEMIGEEKSMRILGKKFRFAEFTSEAKAITVDAVVEIKPKREKAPEQESKEVLEMYKLFVVDDKPEDINDVEAVDAWRKKKAVLQKLIVEKLGYDEYLDVLAPELKTATKPQVREVPALQIPERTGGQGLADNPVAELLKNGAERIAPIPSEAMPTPAEALP